MAGSEKTYHWYNRLFLLLKFFTPGWLVLILRNMLDSWEFVDKLRSKVSYHGMYEILEHVKLTVIFPHDRPCERANITQRSTSEAVTLDKRHFSVMSDGRQRITWQNTEPKLHDLYTLTWQW